MRLPEDIPARSALQEALQPVKKKKGKPKMTWLKVTEKDLIGTVEIDVNNSSAEETIARLENVTLDRKKWAAKVKNIMERNL